MLYSDTDSLYVAFMNNRLNTMTGVILWGTAVQDAIFINPKTHAVRYPDGT